MKFLGKRVARVDRITIRMDSRFKTDSRGFAKIWGQVVPRDAVLEYGPMDGHEDGHLEFVPESTVFDEASMQSLRNAPITFLHPAEPVTSDTSSRVTVGHIIDVKRKGDRLMALHQVEDALTISKIAGGVVELSPGYTTQLDDPEGLVVDGRPMNAIQRDRVYNHMAIVPEARSGHDNALTIDARILPADGLRIQIPGEVMKRITIDGKTIEVDAAQLAEFQKLAAGLGNTDAEGDEEEEEEEDGKKSDEGDDDEEEDGKKDAEEDESSDSEKDADAEADKAPAKGDPPSAANDSKIDAAALTAQITKSVLDALNAKDKRSDASRARSASIVAKARSVLPESYNFDGKSTSRIMRAAIRECDPDLVGQAKALKGDALRGFFQGVIAAPRTRADSRTPISTQRRDSYEGAIEARRERLDHVANCGETGDAAVTCGAVLKLVQGGKE